MDTQTEIKVTRVGKYWICRLLVNGKPWCQVSTTKRGLISLVCKDIMRTYDKMGGNFHSNHSRHSIQPRTYLFNSEEVKPCVSCYTFYY